MEFLKNDTAPANGISDKKKLAAYSAAAVAFVAMAPEAKADIVYVDVDPDEVVVIPNFTDITHVLDLNSDGVDDFAFYGFVSGNSFVHWLFTYYKV